MTPDDLARLQQVAQKATPGEWRVALDPGDAGCWWGDMAEHAPECVICVGDEMMASPIAATNDDGLATEGDIANAEFIATFNPQVVLALLAAVEEQGRLQKAAKDLVAVMDAAREPLIGACQIAHLHGLPYTGPNWQDELAAVRALLRGEDHP